MKITKTGIIIASASAVVVGTAIFFGLTKTGKGIIKKWFGKKEIGEKEKTESATHPIAWKKKPDESTPTQGSETTVTKDGRNTATRDSETPVAGGGRNTAIRDADGGWY